MKGLVGLTCLCWLLATVGPTIQLLLTTAGHTYTYEVETSVLTGIPELSNDYSGIALKYIVKLDSVSRNKAIFTFQGVHLGKINEELPVSYDEDIEFTYIPSPHYERELSKPVIVHFDEQEVSKVEFTNSDPVWSMNIKKALVEKFQLDLKSKSNPVARPGSNHLPRVDPSSSIYTVYEDGIGGECETRYSVLSVPSLDHPDQSEDVLNITKVKNYRNCRSRPIFETDNFDSQGCGITCEPQSPLPRKNIASIWRESSSAYESGCHSGFEPDQHPVKSYSNIWYNISSASHTPLIESVFGVSKHSYIINGKELLAVAQMNITLARKSGLRSQLPVVRNPVVVESLEYQLPEVPYLDNDDSNLYAILGPIHEQEVKQDVIRVIEDLVNSLIPSEPETSQGAGPNVIQIVNALTILKKPELEELYNQLATERTQKVPRKQHMMRKVFLEALGIAGSDEAALFVHDLIVSKRVSDWEAADLVQGIGKNSDEPSDEVIKAYLDLLDLPRVQKGRRLLPAVGIAVGRMIQDSCVEEDDPKPPQQQPKSRQARSAKKYYSSEEEDQPHSPKPKRPQVPPQDEKEDECTPQELRSYIQVIVQKLKDAKSFHKIIAYLETLAHIGSPDVLPYITPYITGEAPNAQALDDEDSDFLALNAIYVLHELVDDSPEEVLPIVSSIYFDPSNDYDQRIAAFAVLIRAEPPLNLLERIVTELNWEVSNQVGSYVYSKLTDLANSTLPCDRKMAQKIQLVFAHAPDFDLGMQYSGTSQYTYYDDDNDYGVDARLKYTASNTSFVPRTFYASLDVNAGPFFDRYLEIGGTAKGMEELLEKLTEPSGILTQLLSKLGRNVQVRNVPQLIDIVKNRLLFGSQDTDIPRAVLFFNIFNKVNHITVDEQYIVELLTDVVEYFHQFDHTSGYSASYVKIWMPSSFVRVVPSSVGLPVTLSQRNPVILTLSVDNVRVATSKKEQTPLTSIALSTDINIGVHTDSISMVYVVDPVNDQIHGAAFEKTYEVSLGKTVEVVLDLEKDTYALSWKPKMPQKVFYHNSRPATFVGQATVIRKPKEEWLGDVNEIETIPEPFKYDWRHEARPLGLSLRVTGDSESPWSDTSLLYGDTAQSDGIVAALLEFAVNPEMINRELHIYLEPHRKQPASEIVFSADYNNHLRMESPQPETNSDQESSEEEEYEKALYSIYGKSYRTSDAQSAVEKLIKKTQATWAPVLGHDQSEPVPATVIHSLDLTMAVKGARTKHHALRLLYAHSLGFRSNWFEAVTHCPGDEQQRPFKVCAFMVAAFPEVPNPFYVEMNTLKSQSAKFEGEIGWGSDCYRQSQIRIEGEMKKSEEQLTSSNGIYDSPKDQQTVPWYYKQCQVDASEGMTQSYACQLAISQDSKLHALEFDIIAPNLPPEVLNVTLKLDLLAKYLMYPNLEFNPIATNKDGRVSVLVEYSEQAPENPVVNIQVDKPSESLVFSKLYLPYYEPPSTLVSYEETFMDQFFGDDYYPECNLMEQYIQTFDNVTVELPENQCQYILAHDVSPDRAFTIIASQIDLQAKTKALSMVLAQHSIKVLPPQAGSIPVVLDGKEHDVTPRKPLVVDFDKETELRIYSRLTSATGLVLVVIAPEDDILVKYDGKNALIKMPRDFQGDQVGLCGDFNDEEFQEFTGPRGCIFVEEEDFVSSYAIPGQSCPKPPMPEGPAFCPSGVSYKPKHEQKSEEEDSNEESPEPKVIKPPKDRHSEFPSRPKHHKKDDSMEVPSVRDRKSDSDETTEDEKPEGPEDCIKEYTHTYVDNDGKTCFSVEPVYKCRSKCRSIRPRPVQVSFHCLPPSKYEKLMKEQASQGVLHQMRNKPIEKTKHVHIPEKCM